MNRWEKRIQEERREEKARRRKEKKCGDKRRREWVTGGVRRIDEKTRHVIRADNRGEEKEVQGEKKGVKEKERKGNEIRDV